MSEKRTVIAPVEAIPAGERKIYKVNNREIGIFNIDGEFFALRNACPHRGAPVCKGRLRPYIGPPAQADDIGGVTYEREDAVVKCPWHLWEFDVRTGVSMHDDNLRVQSFRVAAEDGQIVLYTG